MQPVADDEARVVVHESDEVTSPILTLEDKRKQVGLPEGIGRGTFEAGLALGMGPGLDLLHAVAGFVQDLGNGRGTGRQGWAAQQHVADALAAPVRIGLLEHQDGALGQFRELAAAFAAA
jgi:hypothetical protein